MRILLIQTAFIGDAILATALLEKLHHHFPDAQLSLLVRRGNEELFAGHPFLHELLIWDKKRGKYRGLWQLLGLIRARRYDKVINLQRFGSTGFLTAFSGAKQTIGFDKNPFSRLFTHRVPHRIGPGVHEVDRNADLVRFFTDDTPFRPRLYPPRLSFQPQTPYVCVAPTSVWATKQFPEDQWLELLRALPPNLTVYLLGGSGDSEACARLAIGAAVRSRLDDALHHSVVNLTGTLSLPESAALMAGAVLNFVNDSAPLHLASAVNAPTCAVFCSTVPAFGFGPLADFSRVVEREEPLYCRPCGLHGHKKCPEGHFRCARDIRTAQLMAVLGER
jgi:heptosyltransferase-2